MITHSTKFVDKIGNVSFFECLVCNFKCSVLPTDEEPIILIIDRGDGTSNHSGNVAVDQIVSNEILKSILEE